MPSQELFDRAYSQRATVIKLLVVLAARLGYDHGWGVDDNETEDELWRKVMYVQLPEAQYSWHIAPVDQPIFANVKQFEGKWDGTFHGQKQDLATLMEMTINSHFTPYVPELVEATK